MNQAFYEKTHDQEILRDAVSPYAVPDYREEEISLVELWQVIRRRWLWLVAGLLCGVLVAIAYVTLSTPAYESRASIRIGKVHELGSVDDLDVLALELVDRYRPESSNGAQEATTYLKRVDKAPGNILELTVVGHTPEGTRNLLAQILETLTERHKRIYDDALTPLQQRLAGIERQIRLLRSQAADLGGLVARLKESQPAQASLVAIERGHIYGELGRLERDRLVLQEKIARPSSNPSQVVVQAALPKRPTVPSAPIAVMNGAVLGLLLSIFVVFFKAFLLDKKRSTKPERVV